MLALVKADLLGIFVNPETHGHVQHLGDCVGDDEGKDQHEDVGKDLLEQQPSAATGEQSVLELSFTTEYSGISREADENTANQTTDEVDADHVKGIVIASLELQANRQGADCASHCADEERAPGAHEARSGGYGNQSGNDSRRCAE